MELDGKTIAFLAVAAFLSFLFICCILLSVLFYIRYRKSQVHKDDKEKKERDHMKRVKQQLMKQFRDELRKQTRKRQRDKSLEAWQKESPFKSSFRNKQGKVAPMGPPDDIETACSICLDSLAYGDVTNTVLTLLSSCGHVYHMDCVWGWLERDRSCPICRRDLQMTLGDLKAVTVYHVFNNFDVPSIRESVTQPDLQSRLGYDCLDVVSLRSDDVAKTSRSHVVPVRVAPAPDGDTMTLTGVSVVSGSMNGSIQTAPSTLSSGSNNPSFTNPSFFIAEAGVHNADIGANPSVTKEPYIVSSHTESPA